MSNKLEILTYKFEIINDGVFDVEYYGLKPTQNPGSLCLLFQSISETFNPEKVLETLENVKLIRYHYSENKFKDAQRYFEEIKNEIKKGNTDCENGHFTFSIIERDADDVIYI